MRLTRSFARVSFLLELLKVAFGEEILLIEEASLATYMRVELIFERFRFDERVPIFMRFVENGELFVPLYGAEHAVQPAAACFCARCPSEKHLF